MKVRGRACEVERDTKIMVACDQVLLLFDQPQLHSKALCGVFKILPPEVAIDLAFLIRSRPVLESRILIVSRGLNEYGIGLVLTDREPGEFTYRDWRR